MQGKSRLVEEDRALVFPSSFLPGEKTMSPRRVAARGKRGFTGILARPDAQEARGSGEAARKVPRGDRGVGYALS